MEKPNFTHPDVAAKFQMPEGEPDRHIEDSETGYRGLISGITPEVAASLAKQKYYLIQDKAAGKPASDKK